MEKFIKMTASYIDSSRRVYIRRWREDVYHRRTGNRLRHGGECGVRDYLLDNDVILTKKA